MFWVYLQKYVAAAMITFCPFLLLLDKKPATFIEFIEREPPK
mgnify:CR=1 FL=1